MNWRTIPVLATVLTVLWLNIWPQWHRSTTKHQLAYSIREMEMCGALDIQKLKELGVDHLNPDNRNSIASWMLKRHDQSLGGLLIPANSFLAVIAGFLIFGAKRKPNP